MNKISSLFKSKNTYKIVTIAIISILIIANIVILFTPTSMKLVLLNNQGDTKTRNNVDVKDGIEITQNIMTKDQNIDVDTISFNVGTYQRKLSGGEVIIELYEANSNNLIVKQQTDIKNVKDNKYVDFKFKKTTLLKNTGYYFKVHTSGIDDSNSFVIYSYGKSDNQTFALKNSNTLENNLDYKISENIKSYNLQSSICINILLLIFFLIYLCVFTKTKQYLKVISVILFISILMSLCVVLYKNYKTISAETLANIVSSSSNLKELSIDSDFIIKNKQKEWSYRNDGTRKQLYQLLTVNNINAHIKTINLEIDPKTEKRDYVISIYSDIGDGFNEETKQKIPIIYSGQKNIVVNVPLLRNVNHIRIDTGISVHMGALSLDTKAIIINNISVNNQDDINMLTSKTKTLFLWSFLIALFICTIIFIWYKFKIDEKIFSVLKKLKINIVVAFIILATIFGMCISFVIPIYQVPDEVAHLEMLYGNIGCTDDFIQINDKAVAFGSTGIEGLSGEKVNKDKYFSSTNKKLDDNSFDFDGKISPKILSRPGQTIGVILGQALNLPVFWIFALAELLALGIYIVICALALKLMPFKKPLLMLIMLLPMSIQQAASFSYDSIANAVSFFVIAFILYLKFTKPKVTKRDFAILLACVILLFLSKLIYIVLILLVFIIPLQKLDFKIFKFRINKEFIDKNKKRIPLIIISFLAFMAVAMTAIYFTTYGQYIKMLLEYVSKPFEIFRIVATTTILEIKDYLVTVIASFGWADTRADMLFINFTIVMAFVFSLVKMDENKIGGNKYKLGKINIIWIYIVFIMMYTIVLFTMISWTNFIFKVNEATPSGYSLSLINSIVGVQGRYFIPFIPLFFIPIKGIISKKYLKPGLLIFGYYSISISYSLFIIIQRYWMV